MNIIFKALNDGTRRQILDLLKQGNLSAGELAEKFDSSWPTISHHLDVLKQANLVTSYKSGQFVYYSINMTVVDELLEWCLQLAQTKKNKK
jgi:ArsR family transcriptional regulator, arsenate/arsenite/antimonite-responsive transcriptional repressor